MNLSPAALATPFPFQTCSGRLAAAGCHRLAQTGADSRKLVSALSLWYDQSIQICEAPRGFLMSHSQSKHTPPMVEFVLPDGTSVSLVPGDFIGRSETAALALNDPRVSEAHAYVSLRRGQLFLLSLRRMVAIKGKKVSAIRLEKGLSVEFAPGLYLRVGNVQFPPSVLGIQAPGLAPRPLSPVCSLYDNPSPEIIGRFEPEAPAHLWFVGSRLALTIYGKQHESMLCPGDKIRVGSTEYELLMIAAQTGKPSTAVDGSLLTPLHIVAFYDSVEIRRGDCETLTFGGIGARILCELVAVNTPVSWRSLARELWPTSFGEVDLRRKWDAGLARLRRKLRTHGIRGDLIAADGSGCVRLSLCDGDVAVDEG